jgi:diaminopimelate epimerase
MAVDGIHKAEIIGNDMCIQMHDVAAIEQNGDEYFLNNGSPHLVSFVKDVDAVNVCHDGSKIRYSEKYRPGGTNVNFVEVTSDKIRSRVYERGVENETFSSGTGTVAQALCTHLHTNSDQKEMMISTRGGEIRVSYDHLSNSHFTNIWLRGPVTEVYAGSIEI